MKIEDIALAMCMIIWMFKEYERMNIEDNELAI